MVCLCVYVCIGLCVWWWVVGRAVLSYELFGAMPLRKEVRDLISI